MNPILLTGTIIVNLALFSYTIGIISEQRKHLVTSFVLTFLILGIIFDFTATTFMIIGSKNTPFTLHGILGYSSLFGMLLDNIFLWRLRIKSGINAEVPKKLHIYSRLAYIWWLLAYITGALLVAIKYR
ncbi:MAG: hypothetical protein EPN82_04460 [Bacteroidetes bacterium]|nr:MAG: hypothetical protein EPN82_04460 [Bacteroidota bacterium]